MSYVDLKYAKQIIYSLSCHFYIEYLHMICESFPFLHRNRASFKLNSRVVYNLQATFQTEEQWASLCILPSPLWEETEVFR